MNKLALCVGINDYPGTSSDLYGCVNDAVDWKDRLEQFGFDVTSLHDSAGTKENIIAKLKELIGRTSIGDYLVFSYSGHGTYVFDRSGDEEDAYDEALYTYNGALIDDDIRKVLDTIPYGVKVWVIFDSCFSGTATRVMNNNKARAKFIVPDGYNPRLPVKSRIMEEEMNEVYTSGCSDEEYSYDAYINGRYNGAFSRFALDSLEQNPDATFEEFYAILRTHLPTEDYPQTPQLEGKSENLKAKVFAVDEPEPEPEPTPTPDINWELLKELILKFIQWILKLFGKE